MFHLILTCISWLQPNKGSLHFILSDNNNYNFDAKARCCGFVNFVNNVIDCRCLRGVFCFRIQEKEKDIFYINFYSIIFLQSCFFFFLIYHYFNWILIIDMCVQFVIVVFYDELITNKVLHNCYNTYTTFSKIILHKTLQHYLCIAWIIY